MRFEALELALLIIRLLRKLLPAIRRHDPNLHKQLRDAGSSMPMNLAEGNRRKGRDRIYLWSVAAGSADEIHAGLRTAAAWGYFSEESASEALELLDRLQAMLWKLMH